MFRFSKTSKTAGLICGTFMATTLICSAANAGGLFGGGDGKSISIGGANGISAGTNNRGSAGLGVGVSVGGSKGVSARASVGGKSGINARVGIGKDINVNVGIGGRTPNTKPTSKNLRSSRNKKTSDIFANMSSGEMNQLLKDCRTVLTSPRIHPKKAVRLCRLAIQL